MTEQLYDEKLTSDLLASIDTLQNVFQRANQNFASHLGSLGSAWKGGSAQAFQVAISDWNRNLEVMRKSLSDLEEWATRYRTVNQASGDVPAVAKGAWAVT